MKRLKLVLLALVSCLLTVNAQDVYMLNSESQLEPMVRAVSLGTKVGTNLLAAYGGKMTTYMVLEGSTAQSALPSGANYFYVKNPRQISVRTWKIVSVKSKKKQRELAYMKTGAFTGTSTEYDDLELNYDKINDEIYCISPSKALPKGEYALIRIEAGAPYEIYDFRVDPSLSPAVNQPSNETILALLNTNNSNSPASAPAIDTNANGTTMLASAKLMSDVDTDIPMSKKEAENTFALIISNENYKQVEDVPFALNDGKTFKQYCKLTLGLKDKQIQHLENASLSDIKFALNHLKDICEAYDGEAKLIIHYSGHGIPDESNGEGFILPVDGYASDPSTALKISDFYSQLNAMQTKSTVVFLDACFSGTKRSGEMLASARGVAMKAKETKPSGNLVVFAAAQGDQTAYPYEEKQHGLMTYFLLKKLQESKGSTNLGDLSNYITSNVKKVSIIENGKSQVPAVMVDADNTQWAKQTLQ